MKKLGWLLLVAIIVFQIWQLSFTLSSTYQHLKARVESGAELLAYLYYLAGMPEEDTIKFQEFLHALKQGVGSKGFAALYENTMLRWTWPPAALRDVPLTTPDVNFLKTYLTVTDGKILVFVRLPGDFDRVLLVGLDYWVILMPILGLFLTSFFTGLLIPIVIIYLVLAHQNGKRT